MGSPLGLPMVSGALYKLRQWSWNSRVSAHNGPRSLLADAREKESCWLGSRVTDMATVAARGENVEESLVRYCPQCTPLPHPYYTHKMP